MLFYELTIVKSKREYNILSRWEFMFIDAFINFFFFCLFVCFLCSFPFYAQQIN